jgi:hypothetical protein
VCVCVCVCVCVRVQMGHRESVYVYMCECVCEVVMMVEGEGKCVRKCAQCTLTCTTMRYLKSGVDLTSGLSGCQDATEVGVGHAHGLWMLWQAQTCMVSL